MSRIDKQTYYLKIAEAVSMRGTCLRRNFGSVIVKDDRIISTGYTGSPRGSENCCDLGECLREKMNIPRGQMYEMCKSVHSEQNAIINANPSDMIGATLYLVGRNNDGSIMNDAAPCALCKRMIVNAQIKTVIVWRDNKPCEINVKDWLTDGSLTFSGY